MVAQADHRLAAGVALYVHTWYNMGRCGQAPPPERRRAAVEPTVAETNATPNDLLTVEEAARYLGVSRHKVGRLIRSGDLLPHTSPLDRRRRLVLRSHLDRLREPQVDPETER